MFDLMLTSVRAHLSAGFISVFYQQVISVFQQVMVSPAKICVSGFQRQAVWYIFAYEFKVTFFFQFHSELPFSCTTESNRSAILVLCIM